MVVYFFLTFVQRATVASSFSLHIKSETLIIVVSRVMFVDVRKSKSIEIEVASVLI